MADQSWPATLPLEPEMADYKEDIASNLATFKPDVGPPTTWRRSTLQSSQITCSFRLTDTQKAAFITFFYTTLLNGTNPFKWANPAYGTTGRYLFNPETPPSIAPLGYGLWTVTLNLIKLA
jgi:hypothetical protein